MLHNVSMFIRYYDYNIALTTELHVNIRDIFNIRGAFLMYKYIFKSKDKYTFS